MISKIIWQKSSANAETDKFSVTKSKHNRFKQFQTNQTGIFQKHKEKKDMLEDYPDLLTRRQAQQLLHMGKNRILDHIQSGRLRAMILDGRYLIKKEDVVDFINRLPYR